MADTKIIYRDGALNPRDRRILTDALGDTPVNAESPEQRAALLGAVAALPQGVPYTDRSVTLTAAQIAGIDPLLAANATRRALQFGAAFDFSIALAASKATGMRVYASARDDFSGNLCPTGALYLATGSGFAEGSVITIWEA